MDFSALKRTEYLQTMSKEELDLVIIGGGISGAGIALDAIQRGLRVGLVEMQDFAAGTSSRSTKLIHGGLRYLKQFDISLVAEVGKERAILYENAPHVITPEWMMLPIYREGSLGKFTTSFALFVYDYLAGVKKTERRYMLNRQETLKRVPFIKAEGLLGSGVYVEYKTDDARLTIEVLKKAVELGVKAVNYTKVEELIYTHVDDRFLLSQDLKGVNRITGVKVRDLLTNKEYILKGKVIVNATGAWVDKLREIDKSKGKKDLILTKGVHIVFDQTKFPLNQALYFDNPDGRMIFAIPRAKKTYVGTTDTFYQGDLMHPRMTKEDRDYLLLAINNIFPLLKLTKFDIEASWAGLRALVHEEGKAPSEISRHDEIFISSSGLISIAGGKLTGYRKMAEKIVDIVIKRLTKIEGKTYPKSKTINTKLSGGELGGSTGFPQFIKEKIEEGSKLGLTYEEAKSLAEHYGSNVSEIFQYLHHKDFYNLPKKLYAELLYSLEQEMVVTPLDFFLRRTSLLLFDRSKVIKWQNSVISFMANYFNWSEEEKKNYQEELSKQLIWSIEVE